MPKKSMVSATYAGHEGIVEDARDNLHQLDPSRNLDGSVVEGFESEDREIEDRDESSPTTGDSREVFKLNETTQEGTVDDAKSDAEGSSRATRGLATKESAARSDENADRSGAGATQSDEKSEKDNEEGGSSSPGNSSEASSKSSATTRATAKRR